MRLAMIVHWTASKTVKETGRKKNKKKLYEEVVIARKGLDEGKVVIILKAKSRR